MPLTYIYVALQPPGLPKFRRDYWNSLPGSCNRIMYIQFCSERVDFPLISLLDCTLLRGQGSIALITYNKLFASYSKYHFLRTQSRSFPLIHTLSAKSLLVRCCTWWWRFVLRIQFPSMGTNRAVVGQPLGVAHGDGV